MKPFISSILGNSIRTLSMKSFIASINTCWMTSLDPECVYMCICPSSYFFLSHTLLISLSPYLSLSFFLSFFLCFFHSFFLSLSLSLSLLSPPPQVEAERAQVPAPPGGERILLLPGQHTAAVSRPTHRRQAADRGRAAGNHDNPSRSAQCCPLEVTLISQREGSR